ncbi:hypothetical protein V6N13_105044 [Hibiscus sabdariffa]
MQKEAIRDLENSSAPKQDAEDQTASDLASSPMMQKIKLIQILLHHSGMQKIKLFSDLASSLGMQKIKPFRSCFTVRGAED